MKKQARTKPFATRKRGGGRKVWRLNKGKEFYNVASGSVNESGDDGSDDDDNTSNVVEMMI